MKYAIYPEATIVATASSADVAYPVTNLTDNNYRKKVWKAAATNVATLRCAITGTSQAITLHGTNAIEAVCTITLNSAEKTLSATAAVDLGGGLVKIPCVGHGLVQNDIVLINGTTNYDGVYTLPSQAAGDANNVVITAAYIVETFAITDTICKVIETTTHDLDTSTQRYDRFWQEYSEQTAAHTATIKLTAAAGVTVQAGKVVAGKLVEFANPNYSPKKTPKSYAIIKELRNGARWGNAGEVVRSFSYDMLLIHAKAEDMDDLYHTIDPDPIAMLIVSGVDDNLWCVYGSIIDSPSINYIDHLHASVSVSILESV